MTMFRMASSVVGGIIQDRQTDCFSRLHLSLCLQSFRAKTAEIFTDRQLIIYEKYQPTPHLELIAIKIAVFYWKSDTHRRRLYRFIKDEINKFMRRRKVMRCTAGAEVNC